ncbi:tRNA (uridine(54)-C5)-methyltransferase TrmA [Halioglobus japonicus]|uniref:tRNA/tmRNA (uracil-C(5))-methyltransferase n=2 Tax=Halioglobus japonicus TaxID=930805 RepID=A0AAP8MG15_9GAMM|nr:tRNA (uridine(54)-C5)-methyltransferase TrmA [Halioglobus japonicus]AQA18796.1 tRNA (uridine(54)-C5)-methyltransferase TrmA [Halioglobus japonicus]PLW86827.1 tRNA (uridine(54)-C5)-methyltransferase TrmA [Halioglobus japonicus]GHD23851.1 tRNA/tmRNA (uracil-C(5))-methyltransferase [Halioglobus japonicus]
MPMSNVKPQDYDQLLAAKRNTVQALLSPWCQGEPDVYPSQPTGFRMRAEFRMWHEGDALDYVMFRKDDPKTPVPIESFPIACDSIQALMPIMRAALAGNEALRRKLFQVEFLATLSGEMLVTLIYHRKLEEDWEQQAEALRQQLQTDSLGLSIIGRSRKQKIVLGNHWVTEQLNIEGRTYSYNQYEQAFTQPNARVNINMIEWACERAAELDGDLLELYCGNGNFTLPLARHFDEVIATELAKTSVRAARENIEANASDNVQIIRLAAEEVTQAMQDEREFRRLRDIPKPLQDYDLRTVFVDPPRAGLDDATVKMVQRFDAIIYISCNPHTLADNLAVLSETHQVQRFAMFDQFPYTDHMECGAFLQRK